MYVCVCVCMYVYIYISLLHGVRSHSATLYNYSTEKPVTRKIFVEIKNFAYEIFFVTILHLLIPHMPCDIKKYQIYENSSQAVLSGRTRFCTF